MSDLSGNIGTWVRIGVRVKAWVRVTVRVKMGTRGRDAKLEFGPGTQGTGTQMSKWVPERGPKF